MEGFRFYDIIRWKRGELFAATWNGMYVSALNTPMDLNEDGTNDVAFYTTAPGSSTKRGDLYECSRNGEQAAQCYDLIGR